MTTTDDTPKLADPIAVVLIGTELLTGKIKDRNGPHAIDGLAAVGGALGELRVIGDDVETIARHVRELSASYRYVVTSGGIGPTHDDITMEAIGKALSRPLYEDPELRRRIDERFSDSPEKQRVWARMALVPKGCELIGLAATVWPIYRVDNVFILPGVPQIFALQFDAIASRFSGATKSIITLYVSEGEGGIAEPLTEATKRFPDVMFGSYPVWGNEAFKTRITIESVVPHMVEAARAYLADALPKGCVVNTVEGERDLRD